MNAENERTTVRAGVTLVELLLGVVLLMVALAAILGGYLGQQTLNEHARNLTLAVQDAGRVIEEMRNQNRQYNTPMANPPGTFASWDAWMSTVPVVVPPEPKDGGGPKSLASAPEANERIVVTCQGTDALGVLQNCPSTQMGTEWQVAGPAGTLNPLRITVAVCWRHRGRTIGECAWDGIKLTATDSNGNGVIESPAMLTTLVTCRG